MKYLLSALLAVIAACASPSTSLHVVAEQPQSWVVQTQIERPAWLTPTFFRAISTLAAHAPLDAPVKIEVLSLEGKWGQAWWDDAQCLYVIQLDSDIPGPGRDWAIDVLIHEWAHCLVFGSATYLWEDPHGPIWGVCVSLCYRVLVDPGSGSESCGF